MMQRYLCSQIAVGCFDLAAPKKPSQPTGDMVRASYDAARDGNETVNIWASTDALDADAANSLAVRTKLRKRDRYERGNNGHKCGIHRTQANFVIGTGPTLRMQTRSLTFNSMVEEKWIQWARATQLARKLRQINRAKTGDGEGLALIVEDNRVADPVKLNLRTLECDRLTAPVLRADDENYIDGVHFDEYGTPTAYDILRRHPGAAWYRSATPEFDTYPASRVCHWFLDERPEQHRGIPELTSTLNLFPTARRFREATVAAAETAADFSAIIEMGTASEGNDEVAAFTTLPIDKRTMTITPAGAKLAQMRAEHPATTYDMFNRETISEEARPISMPRNIASCDSSGLNYSSGQLDHQPYFTAIHIEQQECEFDVLDKVFAAWFTLAVFVYGWNEEAFAVPSHIWCWPGKPHNDPVKTATARKIALSTGTISLSKVFAEDGKDVEDAIDEMARDYGLTYEEMQKRILEANLGGSSKPVDSDSTRPDRAENNDVDESFDVEARFAHALIPNGNGHGRFSV